MSGSTLRSVLFISEKIASGTDWIGDREGRSAGLNAVTGRKIPAPFEDQTPIIEPRDNHYTD